MKLTNKLIDSSYKDNSAFITMKHIVRECADKYDLHLLTVGDDDLRDKRVIASSMDLSPAISFLNLIAAHAMFGGGAQESLLDIIGRTKNERHNEVIGQYFHWEEVRSCMESDDERYTQGRNPFNGNNYRESSFKGYLSREGFARLSDESSEKFFNDMGTVATESLENSDVEYVRLGKNLFESDEGQDFIKKHDPMGMVPCFLSDVHPELYLLLLKVPHMIARDQEDFDSLLRMARTIAYGCGASLFEHDCDGSILPLRDDLEGISPEGNLVDDSNRDDGRGR